MVYGSNKRTDFQYYILLTGGYHVWVETEEETSKVMQSKDNNFDSKPIHKHDQK